MAVQPRRVWGTSKNALLTSVKLKLHCMITCVAYSNLVAGKLEVGAKVSAAVWSWPLNSPATNLQRLFHLPFLTLQSKT